MAATTVNPPADMLELQEEDELPSPAALQQIAPFKKATKLGKHPGSVVLRKCRPGRVLCKQGAPGASAFYILDAKDVLALRRHQLGELGPWTQEDSSQGSSEEPADSQFADASPPLALQFRSGRYRRRALEREIVELEERAAEPEAKPQRAATVFLETDLSLKAPDRGLFARVRSWFGRPSEPEADELPESIPVDAPEDVSTKTRTAELLEGDLFGEASCLYRIPRSATVTAHADCYVVEFQRNVLDLLNEDEDYRKRVQETYRDRVLKTHLRKLPFFKDIPDDVFDWLKTVATLESVEAGKVIFEEGDPADKLYIIRTGLVKVVKHARTALRKTDFHDSHWQHLARHFATLSAIPPEGPVDFDELFLRRTVWNSLPASLREQAAGSGFLTPEAQAVVLEGLNSFIAHAALHTAEVKKTRVLGDTRDELFELLNAIELKLSFPGFPENPKNWSDYESRLFHRHCLERAFPLGIPELDFGRIRTLAYQGRGQIFGEIGLVRNIERTASCIAYDHPDGVGQEVATDTKGLVTSPVELVCITKEDFHALKDRFPRSWESLEALAKKRVDSVPGEPLRRDPIEWTDAARKAERLGVVQGQRLMLIDLDRCTRCGSCVDACVNTHQDGYTRLYLDGPRVDKYLVPLTCRSCVDPVCMIGCPVGAINRGDNGQIQISRWCTGCSACANQCPYGSIQMRELGGRLQLSAEQERRKPEGADVRDIVKQAVVCDLCSSVRGQQPACVKACPHDAAFRTEGLSFFFGTDPASPADADSSQLRLN